MSTIFRCRELSPPQVTTVQWGAETSGCSGPTSRKFIYLMPHRRIYSCLSITKFRLAAQLQIENRSIGCPGPPLFRVAPTHNYVDVSYISKLEKKNDRSYISKNCFYLKCLLNNYRARYPYISNILQKTSKAVSFAQEFLFGLISFDTRLGRAHVYTACRVLAEWCFSFLLLVAWLIHWFAEEKVLLVVCRLDDICPLFFVTAVKVSRVGVCPALHHWISKLGSVCPFFYTTGAIKAD